MDKQDRAFLNIFLLSKLFPQKLSRDYIFNYGKKEFEIHVHTGNPVDCTLDQRICVRCKEKIIKKTHEYTGIVLRFSRIVPNKIIVPNKVWHPECFPVENIKRETIK